MLQPDYGNSGFYGVHLFLYGKVGIYSTTGAVHLITLLFYAMRFGRGLSNLNLHWTNEKE